MRADEYVVEELQNTKKLLSEMSAQNIILRQDYRDLKKKYDLIKSLFQVEPTLTNSGYHILLTGVDGLFKGIVATTYTTNPADIEPQFMELLDALELTLPTPTNEELENDQELVEQALEKAKELQENKEDD